MCSISSRHKCASFSQATAALGGAGDRGINGIQCVGVEGGLRALGREVWTCEADPRAISASKEAFAKYDPEGKIHLIEGPAL
jgi:hypothetical protein